MPKVLNQPTKVLVLMSGGVDSSVSAALLRQQGYEVSGVYLKLTDYGEECWAKEMADAAQVAAKLNIPFNVWDVTDAYREKVLKDFDYEYSIGRTPNPDVLCNSQIKFGIALKKALDSGYDCVATGHYARIKNNQLLAGIDKEKDQSYFLWQLKKEQLNRILFPIGEYEKSQVRELAKTFNLHNADKKDSQGVCFLGKIELKKFLQGRVEEKPGLIMDINGKELGQHDGLAHFTIGQRHGFNIRDGGGPYFVVAKDMGKNVLVVANEKDEPKYFAIKCSIRNVNWLETPVVPLQARIRYRGELNGILIKDNEVQFNNPIRAVAKGQSIVFYKDDIIAGGGIIDKVVLLNKISI